MKAFTFLKHKSTLKVQVNHIIFQFLYKFQKKEGKNLLLGTFITFISFKFIY